MRLFERADPARRDDGVGSIDAAVYLDAIRTRSNDVTIIGTAPTPTRRPERRRRIVTAAVAAAVALLVIAAVWDHHSRDYVEHVLDGAPAVTNP